MAGQCTGWLSACCFWVRVVPRSGSVGLVWGGQHLFMALRCRNDMAKPLWGGTVSENLFWLSAGVVVVYLSGQGRCGQCPHKYFCFLERP